MNFLVAKAVSNAVIDHYTKTGTAPNSVVVDKVIWAHLEIEFSPLLPNSIPLKINGVVVKYNAMLDGSKYAILSVDKGRVIP